MPSRTLATAFSLVCFAAALLAGVAAGNAAGTVLGRGLLVLLIAYGVGRVLEAVAGAALQPPAAGLTGGTADGETPAGGVADPAAEAATGPRTTPLGGITAAADEPADAGLRRAA